MDHRVIEYDAGERTTYFATLREALAAAKTLPGRRAVESLDRKGDWICMETMIQLPYGKYPGDGSTLADFLEAEYETITSDPAVLGGKPCFTGTRISVEFVREKLAAGESVADLLRDYPQLPRAAVEALAWDRLAAEPKLVINSAPPDEGDPDDVELTGDDFLY